MSQDLTQATFYCAVCGDAAATLILSPSPLALHLSSLMGNSVEYLSPENHQALAQAIQQQNAQAIYRMNTLWLPSYCSPCQLHYCRQHWVLITQFDDDFPGWYDCTYGFCPHEHKRLLDD